MLSKIDRLSPFRGLHIPGDGEVQRHMRKITPELLQSVKSRLMVRRTPYKLLALIQLNTGFRLSEPLFARRDDLVLDHEIPHLWIRRNSLSDRKPSPAFVLCLLWECHCKRPRNCITCQCWPAASGWYRVMQKRTAMAVAQPSSTSTCVIWSFAVTCSGTP